jgi:hypothetical protein
MKTMLVIFGVVVLLAGVSLMRGLEDVFVD